RRRANGLPNDPGPQRQHAPRGPHSLRLPARFMCRVYRRSVAPEADPGILATIHARAQDRPQLYKPRGFGEDMSTVNTTCDPEWSDSMIFRPEEGIVEFSLLLPTSQALALEEAAYSCGVTAGQMLRGMIQDYFGKFVPPPTPQSR